MNLLLVLKALRLRLAKAWPPFESGGLGDLVNLGSKTWYIGKKLKTYDTGVRLVNDESW